MPSILISMNILRSYRNAAVSEMVFDHCYWNIHVDYMRAMRMPEPMAAGSCQFFRRFRVCFEQEDGNFREGRFQYYVNRQWFRCEN